MTTVTADIAVSLDGFAAGPNQCEENRAEIDGIVNAGGYVMGRYMFGPGRGEWDLDWTGWWGPEPPYHAPVFTLSHHRRAPLEMDGGTTFTFVTDGAESALAQARRAAGDGRAVIAGGAATLNQYLSLGAIDKLRLHVVPITLGERVFDGVTGLTFDIGHVRPTEHVLHVTLRPAGR